MWLTDLLRRKSLKPDQAAISDAERAAMPPEYYPGTVRTGISTSGLQPSAGQLLSQGIKGIHATATRAIANRVSDLDLLVQTSHRDTEGTLVWETDDEHTLTHVFAEPNPVLSMSQLQFLMAYHLNQTGEAYLLKVGNAFGATRELWPMSPASIEKLRGDSNPIVGFVFHGQGGEITYQPEEVIYIFSPDPATLFDGLGVLGPQALNYDSGNFADETVNEYFKTDATPRTWIKSDPEAPGPDKSQREAFYADWRNRHHRRRGSERGLPAFIPSGSSIEELSGITDFGQLVELRESIRDQLLMASGVPRSILGDVVDANRAAAETNQFVFDTHTIQPMASQISRGMTQQLARDFGPNVRVAFADFIIGNEQLRLQQEAQDLSLKVRSVDQVREDRGDDPVSWGRLPVGSFGDIPYDAGEPDEETETPPDDDDDQVDELADNESQPGRKLADSVRQIPDIQTASSSSPASRSGRGDQAARQLQAFFAPESTWARDRSSERALIAEFQRGMRQVFQNQRDELMLSLPQVIEQQRALGSGDFMRPDALDRLFETDSMVRLFSYFVEPTRRQAIQGTAETDLGGLGADPQLQVEAFGKPFIERQGADLVVNVNTSTKNAIRAEISKGFTAGDPLETIAREINKNVFRHANRVRARRIARTEVGMALSTGHVVAFDQADVEGKRWNHSLSGVPDEREWHRDINGQVVERTGAFTLRHPKKGVEKADAPRLGAGGSKLSAGNSVNCQCFITPVVRGG